MLKTKIAVMVSGGGTNLQALIDAQKSGIIKSGEIKLVISNNEDAYALVRAKNAGIKTATILKKDCMSADEFEQRIISVMRENDIDLIVLAGFMSILSSKFTKVILLKHGDCHVNLIRLIEYLLCLENLCKCYKCFYLFDG